MTDIYYADDDRVARVALDQLRSGQGWVVEGSDSGEALIAMVEQRVPDAIVADHNMPGKTGLEISRLYKGVVPVIVISTVDSGNQRDRILRQSLRKDGCPFVAKCNLQRDLRSVVRSAIRHGPSHGQGY